MSHEMLTNMIVRSEL